MQQLLIFINDKLGPISIVIGIVTFFPVLYLWWDTVFGRKRRHEDWFKQARESLDQKRPSILIVDLLDKGPIRTQVEGYRKSIEELKDIPDERIFLVTRTKHLIPEDMPSLVNDIKDKAADILRAGTDTLHLFYAGPVIPSAIIGSIFVNMCIVILYQHQPGTYVNWGPLRHPSET